MFVIEDKWMANYEAQKAYVAITGHFHNEHTLLNAWVRFQRRRIKSVTMSNKQMMLFPETRR